MAGQPTVRVCKASATHACCICTRSHRRLCTWDGIPWDFYHGLPMLQPLLLANGWGINPDVASSAHPPLASAYGYGAPQFGCITTRRLSVAVLLTDTQAAARIPGQTRMAIPQFPCPMPCPSAHECPWCPWHGGRACWHVRPEPILVEMAICTNLSGVSGVFLENVGGASIHPMHFLLSSHVSAPSLAYGC